ncbi:MAG: hypothetical protein GY938_05020 [Ketobacter sp.]|nr:hypothetical protein [Ketobacter sp.]
MSDESMAPVVAPPVVEPGENPALGQVTGETSGQSEMVPLEADIEVVNPVELVVDEVAVIKPAPKFNNTLPFDEIFGEYHGAKYLQNGEYFRGDGEHLPDLSMNGIDDATINGPKTTKIPKVVLPNKQIQGDVDLQRWFDGKEQHMWHVIASAVLGATGTRPASKPHAYELLKTHGVITDGNDMDSTDE